jgi:transposase
LPFCPAALGVVINSMPGLLSRWLSLDRQERNEFSMPFCGLDIHKKEVQAVIVDDAGKVTLTQRFLATGPIIEAFARKHLTKDDSVALEATTNTWPIVSILQPFVQQVVVSNPLRTKAIAQAKIKTDKVDARVLAQLLRTDFLPDVWIPTSDTRLLRQRATERSMLVSDRTRIKNRIHAIFHQRLIEVPTGDLFSVKNLAWLRNPPVALDAEGRAAVDRQLRLFDTLQKEITAVTDQCAANAYQNPPIQLLMTLPGFDFCTAEALLAALGDFTRFPSADQAAAYLGLVPSTYQSGDHCYHGRITKQGRSHARWLVVEAAQAAANHPGPLGVFFRKHAKRKNHNVAKVATAHKLVIIAWHMLKNNEPYRYAQPNTINLKLGRLRVRATGVKRTGGVPKGQPRTAQYGKGGTRGIPSLDQIFEREGLPPIQPLKPGEERILQQQGVDQHARSVRTARRVSRSSPSGSSSTPQL